MDVVALASVITSGVLGLATSAIAVWTTRKNVQITREQRVQQRLAEGYLQLLQLVEAEGLWLQTRVTKFQRWMWPMYEREYYLRDLPSVPEPAGTAPATMTAILGALGSEAARARYATWREAVTAVDHEMQDLIFGLEESGVQPDEATIGEQAQKKLQTELGPAELEARQALTEVVAAELNEKPLRRPGRPSVS